MTVYRKFEHSVMVVLALDIRGIRYDTSPKMKQVP